MYLSTGNTFVKFCAASVRTICSPNSRNANSTPTPQTSSDSSLALTASKWTNRRSKLSKTGQPTTSEGRPVLLLDFTDDLTRLGGSPFSPYSQEHVLKLVERFSRRVCTPEESIHDCSDPTSFRSSLASNRRNGRL